MRMIFIFCSIFIFLIVVFLLVVFYLKSDVSNSEIYEAYNSIEIGQTKTEVENVISRKAPFSHTKLLEGKGFTIILYKYEDKWPLRLLSFARFIEIKYNQEDKVVTKRPETD